MVTISHHRHLISINNHKQFQWYILTNYCQIEELWIILEKDWLNVRSFTCFLDTKKPQENRASTESRTLLLRSFFRMLIQRLQKCWIENPILLTCAKTIQNSTWGVVLDCFYTREIRLDFSNHHFWSHWITKIIFFLIFIVTRHIFSYIKGGLISEKKFTLAQISKKGAKSFTPLSIFFLDG